MKKFKEGPGGVMVVLTALIVSALLIMTILTLFGIGEEMIGSIIPIAMLLLTLLIFYTSREDRQMLLDMEIKREEERQLEREEREKERQLEREERRLERKAEQEASARREEQFWEMIREMKEYRIASGERHEKLMQELRDSRRRRSRTTRWNL